MMIPKKNELLDIISQQHQELTTTFQVDSLFVFGSVAKGVSRPDSDIDILVKYQKTPGLFKFLDLKNFLENITGRKVDLVTEGALKKQLKDQIVKESIRVA